MTTRRRRSADGSALVEITWLTILLLIPLVYLLISVFEVQRGAYGVSAATRAAGRAYVLSPDQETGAVRAAGAARVALRDQDLSFAPEDLAITCEPRPDSCLSPGSVVVVSLDVQVALPLVPEVFGDAPATVRVSGTHRAPYGTFREERP
ncbi:MAG: hypothetical protein GEU93_21355 [Propionibacteriales bacterium]|nr:hypothetical protein [Propionibacteriales bacterium]